jgi:hypothetical protein
MLKTALRVGGQADDYPNWDIFTDRPDLVAKYNVQAFPTIILLRDGREVARRVGYASPAELKRWVDDPKKPISEGENVRSDVLLGRGSGGGNGPRMYRGLSGSGLGYSPQQQPMRYFSPAACRGSA